jgi:hypothetical protein
MLNIGLRDHAQRKVGKKGTLSAGTGRTWTDTALVTTGSTGCGMQMEGAGGSGRGLSGEGKCSSMHIAVYLKRRVGSCTAGGDDGRRSAIVAATLLVRKSSSHRAVLPFLLSLVDGRDCATHGLQISERLKI